MARITDKMTSSEVHGDARATPKKMESALFLNILMVNYIRWVNPSGLPLL